MKPDLRNKWDPASFAIAGIQVLLCGWLFKGALFFGLDPAVREILADAGMAGIWQPAISVLEGVGAILFLFRRAMVAGAFALLLSFGMATYLHARLHQRAIHLIVYAALVLVLTAVKRSRSARFSSPSQERP